jgi:hypothetical protein
VLNQALPYLSAAVALGFIYYWLVTMEPALVSRKTYKQRTAVVAAYATFVVLTRNGVFNYFQLAAECLALLHIFSLVTAFLYGDAMHNMKDNC